MNLSKLNKVSLYWLSFGLLCTALRKEFIETDFLILISGLCYLSIPFVLTINIADSLAKINKPNNKGK